MPDDPYKFERETLRNGATLFYQKRNTQKTALRFLFKAGGTRYEKESMEGCAHLLEHLLWQESSDLKEIEVEDYEYDNLISLDPYTSFQKICVKAEVPVNNLRQLTPLLNNKLDLNAEKVSDEMMKKTKNIVEREMGTEEVNPNYRKIRREYCSVIFHNHPLASEVGVLGYPESLSRISSQDIIEHYDQFFTFSNLFVIAITGNEKEEIKELIQSLPLERGNQINYPEVITDFPPPKQKKLVHSRSEIQNGDPLDNITKLALGALVWTQDINFPWFLIKWTLFEIFYRELRLRQGLTYEVDVNIEHFRDMQKINIIVRVPEEYDEKAREVILSKLEELHEFADLFDKIKKNKIFNLKTNIRTIETIIDGALDDVVNRDIIDSLNQKINKVKQATPEKAIEIVKKWLNRDRILTYFLRP